MKIASVQMQPEVSKSKSSVEPKQDEFSNVLSQAITKESESVSKNENLNQEPKDENDEDITKLLGSIVGMLNIPLVEATETNVIPEELISPVTDINALSIDSVYTTLNTEESIIKTSAISPMINNEDVNFAEEITHIEDVNMIPVVEDAPFSKQKSSDEKIPNITQLTEKAPLDKAFSTQSSIKNDSIKEDISINQTLDITTKIDEITIKEVTKKLEPNEELSVKKNEDVNFSNSTFDKGINRTSFETKIESKEPVQFNDNMQKINDSIVQLMETTTEGNTNVIKVKLYPEDLGTVNVTLRMEEGRLIAKILVDNDYVKGLFTNRVHELNENLVKQNIHLEKINIDLNLNSNNNSSFDLNQNGSYGHGRENHSRRNKYGTFNSEIVNTTIQEERILNSGAISILA